MKSEQTAQCKSLNQFRKKNLAASVTNATAEWQYEVLSVRINNFIYYLILKYYYHDYHPMQNP